MSFRPKHPYPAPKIVIPTERSRGPQRQVLVDGVVAASGGTCSCSCRSAPNSLGARRPAVGSLLNRIAKIHKTLAKPCRFITPPPTRSIDVIPTEAEGSAVAFQVGFCSRPIAAKRIQSVSFGGCSRPHCGNDSEKVASTPTLKHRLHGAYGHACEAAKNGAATDPEPSFSAPVHCTT